MSEETKCVCPNCGYCPHCGRGGIKTAPYYPHWPNPWYTGPIWYYQPSVTTIPSGLQQGQNIGYTTTQSTGQWGYAKNN